MRYAIIDEALKEKYREPIKDIYKWNCLGIQIEGDKYRWCASIAKNAKKYSQETDRLFDEVRTTSGWFVEYNYRTDPGEIVDHIDGTCKRPTKQAHPKKVDKSKVYPYHLYNGSASDPYTFMYQYWTLNAGEMFANICKEIQRDMDRAAEILQAYVLE